MFFLNVFILTLTLANVTVGGKKEMSVFLVRVTFKCFLTVVLLQSKLNH